MEQRRRNGSVLGSFLDPPARRSLVRGATIPIHALLLCMGCAAVTSSAKTALHRYESVEPHMGTLARVTVYTSSEASAKDAFRAAFDRIAELDRILSDYRAESELNQLTKSAVNEPKRVSEDLFAVLQASQALAEATDGAFDITLGPVTLLWREARRSGTLPDRDELGAAVRRTGFRKLHLDATRRTAMLDAAGMRLDAGGIGKGYAASEAIAALTRLGVRSALVALSGDLAFSEPPPGERGWRIGVCAGEEIEGVSRVVELANAAVSTSGNSEQHVDAGGRRYSHIVEPGSGMGVTDDLAVTIIARHGKDADGLDTAVSVMGVERGMALIESRRDAAGCIVHRTAAGTRILTSSNFPSPIAASQARR